MKSRSSKLVRFVSVLCLAVWVVGPRASAQTPGRIAVTYEGGQLTLAWDCVSGRRYQLYSAADLGNPWQEVATQPHPLVASGNRLSYTLSLGPEAQFYRVAELAAYAPTGMVWIPPGTFTMGSAPDEVDRFVSEGPQTLVTLTKGFWMGKCEVTQGEYLAVTGTNPGFFTGNLRRPVETVSWSDATNYCSLLTRQEQAAGRIPTGQAFRLPTEAEWEYACRAGTTTRFSYGDDPGYTQLANYAWYPDNSGETTHPVGQKLPNPWGLYDMPGNVSEWCQDWFGAYPGGTAVDPQGPATGSDRVIRGGDWRYWTDVPRLCRSAGRYGTPTGARNSAIGFRVVLAPGQP